MTNCTFRAKKVDVHDQKNKFPALCSGRVPHFQIRSGATGYLLNFRRSDEIDMEIVLFEPRRYCVEKDVTEICKRLAKDYKKQSRNII